MSKLKKILLMALSLVLVAAMSIGGTVAYLQDDDSDVNVMTLGSVKIAQHEYERKVDADGNYVTDSTGYVLQPFTQAKPLYPATIPTNSAEWTYESTNAMFEQVGANGGGMNVFVEPNAVDKFVFVENTGKTDAYVRTLIAYEAGSLTTLGEWDALISTSYHFAWETADIAIVNIDGNNYAVLEYVYEGRPDKGFHENGILPAGEVTQCSLGQVYMRSTAINEDVEKIDGNKNGTYDILVLSQAVQTAGFADAKTALDTAFGKSSEKAAEWFGGLGIPSIPFASNEQELRDILANGNAVSLGKNIELTAPLVIPAGKEFTIDLAGKTLSNTVACTASYSMISNDGTLTIMDSVGDGKISFTDTGAGDPNVGWASYTIRNSGTLTVNGGTIEHLGTQTYNGNNAIFHYSGTTTINDGVISAPYSRSVRQWNGTLTINDGTFDGQVWVQAMSDVTTTITGGSFKPATNGNDSSSVYVTNDVHTVTLSVSGGTFATKLGMRIAVKCVTGGTFGADPAAYVADGYVSVDNGDGTWSVKEATVYDSTINGGLYEYLPTLQSGDILILPEDTYETSGTFTIPSGVTIKGAEGAEVIFRQISDAQDNIFNCEGDVVIENITFESNRKGYAVTDNTKNHDTDGDITIINCKFVGLATEKNWGVYKNLNGNLTIKNCTFDKYNNAICGVNNGNGSTTTITGCTFTNINNEAIGYVTSSMPADFEATVIANNTGLTAENVIGY